jgi:hypothetical protein
MLPADTHMFDWLQLIRAEYLEIPGLCLTKSQAQRLWGLEPVASEALLAALEDRELSDGRRPAVLHGAILYDDIRRCQYECHRRPDRPHVASGRRDGLTCYKCSIYDAASVAHRSEPTHEDTPF